MTMNRSRWLLAAFMLLCGQALSSNAKAAEYLCSFSAGGNSPKQYTCADPIASDWLYYYNPFLPRTYYAGEGEAFAALLQAIANSQTGLFCSSTLVAEHPWGESLPGTQAHSYLFDIEDSTSKYYDFRYDPYNPASASFCRGEQVSSSHAFLYRVRAISCPVGFTSNFFGPGIRSDHPIQPSSAWGYPCYRDSYSIITLSGLHTIEPEQVIEAQAKVTDGNGQPVAGAKVHLRVEAVHGSGGHEHGDDSDVLRRGKLSGIGPEIVATIPTGADGTFPFTFNAPAVSGTYKFTAWCDDRVCTQQGANNIDVKIDGLVAMPPSTLYEFVGSTADHGDNHYLTELALFNLFVLIEKYQTQFPTAPILRLNDASLVWGGLFDIKGKWKPSHKEHRHGIVIDVRANRTATAIPPKNYNDLINIIQNELKGDFLHENIGTTKEHFHIRLIGSKG